MDERKFTDDEIIRALENCADGSGTGLIRATLDLIKRYKAEIEQLKHQYDLAVAEREANVKGFTAEIERLETENKLLIENDVRNKYPNCVSVEKGRIYTRTLEDYDELIGDISAEAIKEFAERLSEKCDSPHWCVWMSEIDDLVKEMTGDAGKEDST